MSTNEMTREQISALSDGELSDEQVHIALAALRGERARADWDIYHRIGDVLRSDDMADGLSTGFAARMAARLEAEPTIIAPAAAAECANGASSQGAKSTLDAARKWALPSMAAAAAMAAVAFVATPQLMVAMKSGDNRSQELATVAVDVEQQGIVAASASDGVVLRDSRIDDYLMAHQRFSPSVYSTAQFARSATFATDSSK
ncbi:histidine kinase [Herbaspirillum sp. HC18]|nr:histidine kinase [Herbaspirillum sp. HC18]